jgi:hypothetical protein
MKEKLYLNLFKKKMVLLIIFTKMKEVFMDKILEVTHGEWKLKLLVF